MAARVLALCTAALALAGCSSAINGSPSPNSAVARQIQQERTPLTASLAFGDLTTIDYCSMFDPHAAMNAGVSNVSDPDSSFDDCYVEGQLDGRKIDIELGFLDRNQPGDKITDPTKTLPRGLVAKRQAYGGDGNSCSYYLSFPDSVDLDIYSYFDDPSQPDTSTSTKLCSVDADLLNGVVTAVTQKKVTHVSFPPGSLGTIDPCPLIPDSLVLHQIGLPVPREDDPSKHHCRWSNQGIGVRASLWFYVDKAPEATPAMTTETIANRSSIVNPQTPLFCLVDTVIGPAPGAKNGQVQVAETYVNLGTVGKDACGIARAFANQAWPHLPSS